MNKLWKFSVRVQSCSDEIECNPVLTRKIFEIIGPIQSIWWQNIYYFLANLWNRITTKNFDIFRIISNHIKTTKVSQSDPVLNRQFSKKLQSNPALIRPKLASVLIQSDTVLIRAHLWAKAHSIKFSDSHLHFLDKKF